DVLKQPSISGDARFATQKSRLENREVLTKALDAEFRKQPTTHWLKVLGGVLPVAPVYELGKALDSPFLQATDMIKNVPHPERANLRVLANPIKINGQRLSQRVCSAPGADNPEILGN